MGTHRRSVLSLAQQALALQSRFPDGSLTLKPTALIWVGALQPTELSRNYTVRIVYRLGIYPQVRVIDPILDSRLGETLPHVFREGTLCLHLADEWDGNFFLADTIVPWSAEWLAFYEIWKATGVWEGGGVWPPVGSSDSGGPVDAEESGNCVVAEGNDDQKPS